MRPPIWLIHGTFSHGGLLDPWTRFFESAGYECHAPSLPGRQPTDHETLRKLSMADALETLMELRAEFRVPPIVIGHSMGGLLAQQVAAATSCSALVLLASVPPGVLWAQPCALPHLARLLPRILSGRPVLPPTRTLKAVVFNDLPAAEAEALCPQIVADSGRMFRSLILGLSRVPPGRVACPVLSVSGGVDRNVSAQLSRAIAARYGATHRIFPQRGHWLIAESGVEEVAGCVLEWLRTIGLDDAAPVGPPDPAAPRSLRTPPRLMTPERTDRPRTNLDRRVVRSILQLPSSVVRPAHR